MKVRTPDRHKVSQGRPGFDIIFFTTKSILHTCFVQFLCLSLQTRPKTKQKIKNVTLSTNIYVNPKNYTPKILSKSTSQKILTKNILPNSLCFHQVSYEFDTFRAPLVVPTPSSSHRRVAVPALPAAAQAPAAAAVPAVPGGLRHQWFHGVGGLGGVKPFDGRFDLLRLPFLPQSWK